MVSAEDTPEPGTYDGVVLAGVVGSVLSTDGSLGPIGALLELNPTDPLDDSPVGMAYAVATVAIEIDAAPQLSGPAGVVLTALAEILEAQGADPETRRATLAGAYAMAAVFASVLPGAARGTLENILACGPAGSTRDVRKALQENQPPGGYPIPNNSASPQYAVVVQSPDANT